MGRPPIEDAVPGTLFQERLSRNAVLRKRVPAEAFLNERLLISLLAFL